MYGCVCYAKTDTVGRKKLDDRSRVLVHLGIKPGSKVYRLIDPDSKRIIVSRDVVFDEEKEWRWNDKGKAKESEREEFEINLRRLTDGTIEGEATIEVSENESDDDENVEAENDFDNEEDDVQMQPRRSTRISTKPSYLDDYILLAEVESEQLLMIINDEPWDFNEAKELKVWIEACKDEICYIEKNNTWDLVELPAGVKPIGLK